MPQMIYKEYNPTNRGKKGIKALRIAHALLQTNRKLLPSYKPSRIFSDKNVISKCTISNFIYSSWQNIYSSWQSREVKPSAHKGRSISVFSKLLQHHRVTYRCFCTVSEGCPYNSAPQTYSTELCLLGLGFWLLFFNLFLTLNLLILQLSPSSAFPDVLLKLPIAFMISLALIWHTDGLEGLSSWYFSGRPELTPVVLQASQVQASSQQEVMQSELVQLADLCQQTCLTGRVNWCLPALLGGHCCALY